MNIELNDLKMAVKMRFASVWQTVDGKVVSFDSVFEEALNCLSISDGMFRALKRNKKKQFLHCFPDRIYWPFCQLALGKV